MTTEILNDEQLDQVAGGTQSQTDADALFFNKLGFPAGSTNSVREFYDYYGVQFRGNTGSDNEYKVNGKTVSHLAAMDS